MDESNRTEPGQARGPETGSQSVGETVAGILEDLQGIVRSEVQLAKAELKEDATRMGRAGGMVAGGGVMGFTGFIFMMLGLTFLIARKLPLWLSASLVGAALGAVAASLGMTGREQLRSERLMPEQTIESLRENKAWASREVRTAAEQARSVTE